MICNTQTEEEVIVEEKLEKEYKIILYNDHVNTFDFVITTLMELCDQDRIQAEQCATLVHYKGKCDVKSGKYEDMEPICSELLHRGLTAEIC